MIKTHNHRARLIGKETVRTVLWDATVAGLNPDAATPRAQAAAGEYYLAADVEEVQAEIVARLREQLDQLCERIAQRMPHLLAVDLLRIRLLYLETLAPLLGH